MNYLVDTHILLWSFLNKEMLSENVQNILLDENNNIFYSPINLWEIAIKYGIGELDVRGLTPEEFFEEIENSYYLCKTISNSDIVLSYKLKMPEKPIRHKDPFDRFLIWEAIRNDYILLTVDGNMKYYEEQGLRYMN
jgi:PIN domain nuclease of toxin-antitoxin system